MQEQVDAARALADKKEGHVQAFLAERKGGAFLEIGIGGLPKLSRIKLMLEQGISYVGVDFAGIAEEHERRIRGAGMGADLDAGRLRFVTNSKGTYNYNLLKLLRAGKRFDLIYLDGHHTLDVDVQAAVWAARMLKPDGLLAVDDIEWNLMKVARAMHEKFDAWLLYDQAYDIRRYSAEELNERNMKTIVNEILIPVFGFEQVERLSLPGWAVLKRKK